MKKLIYDCECSQGELIRILESLASDSQQIFNLMFKAFLQHKHSHLKAADDTFKRADKTIKEATQLVLATFNTEEQKINNVAVLELLKSLGQIHYDAQKISGSIEHKIDDSVLFSDKAVTEIRDVFSGVIDCLKQITDLVATNNLVLADHLVQRAETYSKVIKDYASEHEERMIKGICLPKSSIIYLTLLDALKDVLWNVRAIGMAFKK